MKKIVMKLIKSMTENPMMTKDESAFFILGLILIANTLIG